MLFELSYHSIQDVWFYSLVAFILEALAVYVWQYRQSPGAVPLAGVLVNRSIWLISLIVIGTTADYEVKLFGAKVQQVTASLPPVFWLVFMMQMVYRWQRGNWRMLSALMVVPVISWLLLFTNQWHGLYWTQIRADSDVLTFARGLGNMLMVSYNFLLLPAILYYGWYWIRQCTGLRRWQAIIIILAQFSGIIGTFNWVLTQHTGILSPLPLSSLIAGVAWTYGFFYLRVLNLLPLAQAVAVEIMGNCLAVVDTEGWVVDLNDVAALTLGIMPEQAVGKQATEVFVNWPVLTNLLAEESEVLQEFGLETDTGTSYYEFHLVKLADQSGRTLGKAFVWKDITAQKQAQLQLMEQEKVLSILAERKRIGREIHDGRGQLGGYLQMELQTIHTLLDKNQPDKAKLHIKRLGTVARDYNTDVRETIAGLKTGLTSSNQDFFARLQEYLDGYEKNYGITTTIITTQPPDALLLDIAAKVQLLRIIQEALNNIRKHAKAQRVQVSIQTSGGETTVCVADDGQGFDASAPLMGKNHYGLGIMKERAEEAGGELQIESEPGVGTKVTVKFSLRKVGQHEDIVGG